MRLDGDKTGKDLHLFESEHERKSLFNLNDSVCAENMETSQDLVRALTQPQMAKTEHRIIHRNDRECCLPSRIGDTQKLICCKLKLKGQAQNVLDFKTHNSRVSSFVKFFNCTQKRNEKVREHATLLRVAGRGTIMDRPQQEVSVRAKSYAHAVGNQEDRVQSEDRAPAITQITETILRGTVFREIGPKRKILSVTRKILSAL
ncbi:hypothetical protein PR048_012843 [Dryococelus australis]|uniref:Uncharacterized protein n=1 Tax=Dryococelus australis TaxID=614101 RepID=A0ABQ9HQM9_9NEOP|nr:hypothetical protein PR048_012843 [Dryococelus australis]